eukprot:jgi/Mesvir1/25667/Mv01881-RA.1
MSIMPSLPCGGVAGHLAVILFGWFSVCVQPKRPALLDCKDGAPGIENVGRFGDGQTASHPGCGVASLNGFELQWSLNHEFLCPLSANTYGIDFQQFEIKDYDSGRTLFSVKKEPDSGPHSIPASFDPETEAKMRTIKYTFPIEFLRYKTVRTSLTFSVGMNEVPNFRMIERHYFGKKLLKSYDFTFGFCIPGSTNSWEAIYPVPPLSEQEIDEMVAHPFESRSDSFYFVGDKLVMHNKAEYEYRGD